MERNLERAKNILLRAFEKIDWSNVVLSVCIIAIMIVLLIVFKSIFKKLKKKKQINNPMGKTVYKIALEITQFVVILLAILFILSVNGVNVGSVFAGLGIASAIVGLALQDILKDLIMGIRIMTDGFFVIGDNVKYKDYEGTIVAFGLRSTRIMCWANGRTVNVCNRNIDEVIHIPKNSFFDIDVPLSYEDDLKTLRNVMTKAAAKIEDIPDVNQCKFIGAQSFNDSSVSYRIRIWSELKAKYQIQRDANGIIQDVLAENSIVVPYNQLDIHNK